MTIKITGPHNNKIVQTGIHLPHSGKNLERTKYLPFMTKHYIVIFIFTVMYKNYLYHKKQLLVSTAQLDVWKMSTRVLMY